MISIQLASLYFLGISIAFFLIGYFLVQIGRYALEQTEWYFQLTGIFLVFIFSLLLLYYIGALFILATFLFAIPIG